MSLTIIWCGTLGIMASAGMMFGCVATSEAPANGPAVDARNVRSAALTDDRRTALHTSDVSPGGDIVKQWRWDRPWEVRDEHGDVIRRMSAPVATEANGSTGPHVTVIDDPQKGTIYEAFFQQQTGKAFALPVTLSFYGAQDAPTPLFTLSFIDVALRRCQAGLVSRGGIKRPGIPRPLLESAQWIAVRWESVPYDPC